MKRTPVKTIVAISIGAALFFVLGRFAAIPSPVPNTMELRGFGKGKKRTWYMGRPFTGADFAAMLLCALLLCASIALNVRNGGRFWNPFRA